MEWKRRLSHRKITTALFGKAKLLINQRPFHLLWLYVKLSLEASKEALLCQESFIHLVKYTKWVHFQGLFWRSSLPGACGRLRIILPQVVISRRLICCWTVNVEQFNDGNFDSGIFIFVLFVHFSHKRHTRFWRWTQARPLDGEFSVVRLLAFITFKSY